jgi:hypothetical protein
MSKEVKDLIHILEAIDAFKKEYNYNPFDNYAWREVLTFHYLKTHYPTIYKLAGRYGADGACEELNLTYIEQKSTKAKKRKKTLDYNIRGSKYQIDMSKSLEKTFKADAFIFSLFDSDDSTYPVHVVFVHDPVNVQKVKDLILEKQKSFDARVEDKKTHAHIDLNYDELRPLGQIFDNQMSKTNIMEFIL